MFIDVRDFPFQFYAKDFSETLEEEEGEIETWKDARIAAGLKLSIPNVLIIGKAGSVYVRRKIRIRGVGSTKIGTGERGETKEAKKSEKEEREREERKGASRYKKGDIFRVAVNSGHVDVHGPSHPSRGASTERRMVKGRRFRDSKSFEARTNEARNRMRGKDYSLLGPEFLQWRGEVRRKTNGQAIASDTDNIG